MTDDSRVESAVEPKRLPLPTTKSLDWCDGDVDHLSMKCKAAWSIKNNAVVVTIRHTNEDLRAMWDQQTSD